MALKLLFGQYKGRAVDNVPSNYLRWVLTDVEKLHPSLKEDIERVLAQRKAGKQLAQEETGNRQHLRSIGREGRR